jgi:hypothetical protein
MPKPFVYYGIKKIKSKNHPTLVRNVFFGWKGWERGGGGSSPKEKSEN